MAEWNTGAKNGFWRGGRSIASNGYVLIRVGKDHHLADVRGYAYEHRLVAEKKIGRQLVSGEQVHHINGDTQDNSPDNLEVVQNISEHRVLHRRVGFHLRLPNELNPIIPCECGCGEMFARYDTSGRPRKYISGHNPPSTPTRDQIIAVLQDGPASLDTIVLRSSLSKQAIKVCLSKMYHRKLVTRIAHGIWALA